MFGTHGSSATITYSNDRRAHSTGTYACEGGTPPSGGDAILTCEPDGSWSGNIPTGCWPEWDSGSVVNKNGKHFKLYLLPATTFTWSVAGGTKYKGLCEAAGLRTVASGYSSYANSCSSWNCMPLPASGWGTTSNVDDSIHTKTTWGDSSVGLVMTYYSDANYPYNYPHDSGAFDTSHTYHPICGKEIE